MKLLLCLLAIFLPAAGIIVVSSLNRHAIEIERAKNDTLLLVQSLAAQQKQLVASVQQLLDILAHLPEVQRRDPEACNELFEDLKARRPFYSAILAATPDGNVFAASSPLPPGDVNLSGRRYFQDAVRTLDFSAGEYVVGKISKIRAIAYAYPVFGGNRQLSAVLVAGLKLDGFNNFVTKLRLPAESSVIIADEAGIRLFRYPVSNLSNIGGKLTFEELKCMLTGRDCGIFDAAGSDGVYRVYAFRSLKLEDCLRPYLFISVGFAKREIVGQANRELLRNLMFLGTLGLVAAALVWGFADFSILGPVRRLASTADRFGVGNMDARTGLPHTPDELGRLAASFDKMASLLEMRDSERDRTEAALVESRRQLTDIIAFLPDATFVVDKEGKVMAWNRAMEVLTGVAAADMVGKGDCEYALPIYGERRPMLIDSILSCRREGIEAKKNDAYVWTGTGDTAILGEISDHILGDLYLSATASALRDSHGNIVGAVESIRNITELKDAEEEKSKLEAQLLRAQKMEAFSTLAGGIAHDFNNILGIVLGYSELVSADLPEGSRAKDNIEQVLKACLRAKDLVRQILTFSRPEDGQERCPVDIRPVIKESLKFLRASLPATIEMRQAIFSKSAIILADPTQIHQVLANLCANAMHAMEERGGILEVSLTEEELNKQSHPGIRPGPYLRLTVRDTGHGIEAETLPRIFDPYFTTKDVGKGTGLGLAMVQGVVKNHEGLITVSSQVGEGTTFNIYFPKVDAAQASPDESRSMFPRGTERILFVDDEKSLVDLWCKSLSRLGYKMTPMENGIEALHIFRAGPEDFDLVITDYTMPRMTGIDLAKEIMKVRPEIPIILCTGMKEMITEADTQGSCIRTILAKPLQLCDVALAIREILHE